MANAFFNWGFHSIWAWLGTAGIIIAAAIAVAVFVPGFRKTAISVAVATFAVFALLAKGYRDGKKNTDKKWDKAEAKSVERGETARHDAEEEVAKTPKGTVTDKFDREDL